MIVNGGLPPVTLEHMDAFRDDEELTVNKVSVTGLWH